MTKLEAKELALRVLDEATINGQPAGVELTADYTDKFDYFLNDALVFIANIFPIHSSISIKFYTPYQVRGPYVRVEYPEDIIKIRNVVAYSDKGYEDVQYIEDSENSILVERYILDSYTAVEMNYHRLPETITFDAPDDTVLDIPRKAESIIPIKLAVDATAGNEETSAISAFLNSKLDNLIVNLMGDGEKAYSFSVERIFTM